MGSTIEKIHFKLDKLISQFRKIDLKSKNYEKIIEIGKGFDDFNTRYLFRDKNSNIFYKFCDGYGFELNVTIASIIKNCNLKNVNVSYSFSERDELVQVHKVFFEKAIREVIKNAEEKAARIDNKINLTISTSIVKKHAIELKFTQDSNFDETGIIGGFNSIVRSVLREFGLPETFKIVETRPRFIFKINFRI